jgi:hypothetical protein
MCESEKAINRYWHGSVSLLHGIGTLNSSRSILVTYLMALTLGSLLLLIMLPNLEILGTCPI